MNKAKALKLGDTIGLIAPASPSSKEEIKKSEEKLIEMGFKVKLGRSPYEKYGYLAGTDSIRAQDINNMFKDDEVQAIICTRGGYGSPKILELLDYEMIRSNPKIFLGYSDITALHMAFNQKSDLITFHGPMAVSDMIGDFSDFSRDNLFKAIMKKEVMGKVENPGGEVIASINPGIAEGSIIGGNLSLIADTIGTPYEIDTKGKLLFIEEVGEEPYNIDRMLNQLRLSGKLKDADGIILGDFNGCTAKNPDDLNLSQVIEELIKPAGKPTICNVQAGHCEPMVTIPFGVKSRLDADKCELTILESAVE